ncbi:MAG: four-carbon acid sugar kinase family protein, partial [Clostridia bacterium]
SKHPKLQEGFSNVQEKNIFPRPHNPCIFVHKMNFARYAYYSIRFRNQPRYNAVMSFNKGGWQMKIAAMADDLTGALDAGIQMQVCGFSTVVGLGKELLHSHDWLIINTNTRNLAPDIAASTIREMSQRLTRAGFELAYKKIDSTLRGNIGAELEALLLNNAFDAVLLCPSLPPMGRVLCHGYYYVNHVPLEKMDLSKDPFSPVKTSCLRHLVAAQTRLLCAEIDLSDISKGATALASQLQTYATSGMRILIADAVTNEDLKTIALALHLCKSSILPCGSAGLFAFADQFLLQSQTSEPYTASAPMHPPAVILSGSPAVTNIAQIQFLQKSCIPLTVLTLPVALLGTEKWAPSVAQIATKACSALLAGNSVLLDGATIDKETLGSHFGERSDILTRNGETLRNALAKIAKVIATKVKKQTFVLLGGDTAATVLSALKAENLILLDQPLPYIPHARIQGGLADGCDVVSKAGGFGDEDCLVKLLTQIQAQTPSSIYKGW